MVAPQAVAVQGSGDQLLAGAGLPQDQDIGIAGRHLQGQVEHLAEGGTGKDDRITHRAAAAQLLAQTPVFSSQAAHLQHVFDHAQHLFLGERLGQVIISAQLDGLDRIVHGAKSGHDDHRQLGAGLFGAF